MSNYFCSFYLLVFEEKHFKRLQIYWHNIISTFVCDLTLLIDHPLILSYQVEISLFECCSIEWTRPKWFVEINSVGHFFEVFENLIVRLSFKFYTIHKLPFFVNQSIIRSIFRSLELTQLLLGWLCSRPNYFVDFEQIWSSLVVMISVVIIMDKNVYFSL